MLYDLMGTTDSKSPVIARLTEEAKHRHLTLTALLTLLAEENALLETKTVAQLSGLTPWWVRQLIARGELRAINVGSGNQAARWRVDPEDLKAFLASRESRPRDLVAAA